MLWLYYVLLLIVNCKIINNHHFISSLPYMYVAVCSFIMTYVNDIMTAMLI
jgi:hypothetical protein